MRRIGSIAALLVSSTVAPAIGVHNAVISIESPGSVYNPGSGMNELLLQPPLPDTFYVDILVTSDDPLGMSAFGITLTDRSGELSYAGMEVLAGRVLNYCGQYSDQASRPGMPDNNWSQPDGAHLPAGTLPMGGPPVGEEIRTANEPGGLARDGLAVWLEFDVPPPPYEDSYTIAPSDDWPAYVGDSGLGPMNLTVIPLRFMVPEPASVLLLLGGLPLLHRRTRARRMPNSDSWNVLGLSPDSSPRRHEDTEKTRKSMRFEHRGQR